MKRCRHGFFKCADEQVGRRAVGFLQVRVKVFDHSSWIVIVRGPFETIEESANYSRSSHKCKNLLSFNGGDGFVLSELMQPGLSSVLWREDAGNIYLERQTESQFDEHFGKLSLSLFPRSETLARDVGTESIYAFVISDIFVLSSMMHLLLIL
jgi:hypothetical protein